MRGRRQSHRKQSRLECVVTEDVGEAGTDHRAKAEIEECPGCVLARRSAAEVVAGDKDRRVSRMRRVQRKLGARLTMRVNAPVGEEMRAESTTLDRLEKSRRDDLIRIHVLG